MSNAYSRIVEFAGSGRIVDASLVISSLFIVTSTVVDIWQDKACRIAVKLFFFC